MDQIIKKIVLNIIGCLLCGSVLTGCTTASALKSADFTGIPNPASVNCIQQGGKLTIEKSPSGEYGVCRFEDNRQCEEWALLRGQCPKGGLKVTGYATKEAVFCVITGGIYRIKGKENTPKEQGSCTLSTGKVCNSMAYYKGRCTKRQSS